MWFLPGEGDVIMFCDKPTKWPIAKKNLQNRYINIQGGEGCETQKTVNFVVNWVSSYLSFFFSAFVIVTCIFTTPTFTSIIIIFKPFASNVKFHYFIPIFDKMLLLYIYH